MTKLLILSDSHSNRLALEHILKAEADHIDALIFLGDGLRDLELALTKYPLPPASGLRRGRKLRFWCTGTAGRACGL